MSKAILILDQIPVGCERCPILDRDEDGAFCAVEMREVGSEYNWSRPEWCPLKEMPEPFIPEPAYYTDEESFQVGYNAALDDVEGKNDEQSNLSSR